MWILYTFIYIISTVIFTHSYKLATKSSTNNGTLTVLLEFITSTCILLLIPFFKLTFPTDYKMYLSLGIACIFYAISDRINTTVRSKLEASTFGVIKQLSTVFMILWGLLFFKEPFICKKIIGAILIIFSNILIFYKKTKQPLNKYIYIGILANFSFSIALFFDINISNNFNLAFYIALTLLIPALFITIKEKINLSKIKKEFINGDKKAILVTSLCWSIMSIAQLKAYQLGNIISVATLCSLTVFGNVVVGYIFFKEKDNLLKKLIAAILITISIFLIKG